MHDEATPGLKYNNQRFYHTQLGRWINRDPLEYVDGMNNYQYVDSNPIRYVDSQGLEKQAIVFDGLGAYNDPSDDAKDPNPNMGSTSLSQMKKYAIPVITQNGGNVHYFSQLDVSGAYDKIMNEFLTPDYSAEAAEAGFHCGAYDSLIIAGWSHGGSAAHELAKKLSDEGIQVNLVFTIDPFYKPFEDLGGLKSFSKQSNVETWHNYYQKVDIGSAGLGLKGHSVKGADTDAKISKQDFINKGFNWKMAHIYIVEYPDVLDKLGKSVEKVPEYRESPY